MVSVSMAALLACLNLGVLLPGAVCMEEGPSRGAAAAVEAKSILNEDDACDAEGSTSGTCALSALQQQSFRGLTHDTLAADIARLNLSSNLWHRLRSASYKDFPAELPAGTDRDWVWPRDTVYWQLHSNNHFVEKYSIPYQLLTPWVLGECQKYITYFWPMYSFWTQESLRRTEALPDNATPQQTKQLQHFVRQASYLNCVLYYDPRKGSEWSRHVVEHMETVRGRPSTDLEMPDLPEFFGTEVPEFLLYVVDACIYWTSAMTCNLGYIARDLKGSKAGDEICWDKVQVPEYGYSMFGFSLMLGRNSVEEEPYNHSEYLECQEKPLAKELLDDFCPFAGHFPDGLLGVPTWGHGPAKGTKRYEDVLKCEAKMGLPEFAHCSNYPVHRASEGNDIDVVKPTKGPLITYEEMYEIIQNETVEVSGYLAGALTKAIVLHRMRTTDAELKGLRRLTVNAVSDAMQDAARNAADLFNRVTHEVLPVMPEFDS